MAAGRKLTTGEESAPGARNLYDAKTVLSRFDIAKTPIRINRVARAREQIPLHAPRLLTFLAADENNSKLRPCPI